MAAANPVARNRIGRCWAVFWSWPRELVKLSNQQPEYIANRRSIENLKRKRMATNNSRFPHSTSSFDPDFPVVLCSEWWKTSGRIICVCPRCNHGQKRNTSAHHYGIASVGSRTKCHKCKRVFIVGWPEGCPEINKKDAADIFPEIPIEVAKLLMVMGFDQKTICFLPEGVIKEIDQLGKGVHNELQKQYGTSFYKLPLKEQAKRLKIILEIWPTKRDGKIWHDGKELRDERSERYVLQRLQASGFVGAWDEGSILHGLWEAADLKHLVNLYEHSSRSRDVELRALSVTEMRQLIKAGVISRPELLKRKCNANFEEANEYVEKGIQRTMQQAGSNNYVIEACQRWLKNRPVARKLWEAAAQKHLFDLGAAMLQHGHLLGWPDLTVAKNGDLSLVEVKTTDKLRANQVALWFRLLKPSGIKYRIIQLIKDRDPK